LTRRLFVWKYKDLVITLALHFQISLSILTFMRRIFTLLLLGALFTQTNAQVLFQQDFESGSIEPMTAVDGDGKTVDSNISGIAGPTWRVYNRAASGSDRWAVSTSWYNPVGQADDWLISPPIEIEDSLTYLIWRAFTPDASYRDGYQVRVSTSDNELGSFTDLILNVPAEETSPKTRAVSLGDYAGQTIYFAFRNNSNDKFLLYVDDIVVKVLKRTDVSIQSVSYEKYNTAGAPIPLKLTVFNSGVETIDELSFSWTSDGQTYTGSYSGLNLKIFESLELTHEVPFAPAEDGQYVLDLSLEDPNGIEDEDPDDNSGTLKFYISSSPLPKKVIVEEATGTWCGWCPRGTVNMDLLAANHADVAIPIAVHNNDPMAIAAYDGPLSASVGGYPSGHVDRKRADIDPSQFISAVNNLRDRVVPAFVEVDASFDETTRLATFTGRGYLAIPTNGNELRFVGVITEDGVKGTGAAWAQVNYYANGQNGIMGGYENYPDPVPASEMVYNYVARAIFGGYFGMANSVPDTLEAFEEFTVEFSYAVPANYKPENMKAIVFLLDEETGEILNGASTELTGSVGVPLIPQGSFALYPNPTSDYMNLTLDYQTDARISMRIYTVNGALVKDLNYVDLSDGKAQEQINVADLQPGMYLLELRNKNAVTALPFTKL